VKTDDSDEAGPVLPKAAVQWLQMSDRFVHVRQTEKPEHDDNDRGGHRNQEGESAGVFRSKQVEQSDDEDGGGGEFFRMWHA